MSFQQTMLDTTPIRYYLLNESSGTNATDIGSQAANATYVNGFTPTPGLVADSSRTAPLLNGTTQYVSMPTTGLPTGNATISLSCIVQFPNVPGAGSYMAGVILGSNSFNNYLALYLGDAGTNGNVLDCAIQGDGTIFSNSATLDNAPHLWQCTYNGSTFTLYVDGKNVGSTSTSSLNITYGNAYIGQLPGGGLPLSGVISDVAIHNVALSAKQCSTLYEAMIDGGSTVTQPLDGHGIYEDCDPTDASAFSRLDTIAAGGFKLVLNYALLSSHTHIADVIAYINHAANKGLRVIVALHATNIWKTPAIQANYPLLYTDSGNQSTTNGFDTYIVNQTKNLAGTWGYYVADEPGASDHTACLAHYGYIAAADPTKPKLLVEPANNFPFWTNKSVFVDCATVVGDDFYPIGTDDLANVPPAQVFSGIQKTCKQAALQSTVVLQTFDRANYGTPPCANTPTCSYFPHPYQIAQQLYGAMANMSPRLILWYSYMDIFGSGAISSLGQSATSQASVRWAALKSIIYSSLLNEINFPIVSLSTKSRDGHMTATSRDGLSLTTQARG